MTSKKQSFELFIPVNPVPASRPRVGRWGTYYGKTYAAWRKEVTEFMEKFVKNNKITKPFEGPFKIALTHSVRKPKTSKRLWPRGDIDNYDKAVLDALVNDGLLIDDDMVLQLHSVKMFATETEREGTTVHITFL